MKLKREYVLYNTDEESMLAPASGAAFSGLVRGNKTLGVILSLLQHDTDEAAIIRAMCAQFDASEDLIASDVRTALARLREIGALDE